MLAIIIRNRRQSLIKNEANVIDHEVNGTAIATNIMIENVNYLSTDTAENTIYEVAVSSDNITWSIEASQVSISSLYLEPLQGSSNDDAIASHYFELSNSIADSYTTVCDNEDSYDFPANV